MGYLQLFRNRPVLVLWSSSALSILGDRLYGLAVMWVVYAATGSASLMGLVAVIESLPYILIGSFGRRIMPLFATFGRLAWLDAGRAMIACLIPLLWSPDRAGLVVLFILIGLLGTLGAVADPNVGALVPTLASADQVRQIVGLLDLTTRIAAIVGPGCVGLILLVVSDVQLFAVDGATFAVSALALAWLRVHTRRTAAVPSEAATGRAERRPAVAVGPIVRDHPDVGVAIGLHGAAFLVAAVLAVGLPAILAVRLGQGAAGYGLVLAAIGVGALAGNLLVGGLLREHRWLGTYCAAWVLSGLALIGFSVASTQGGMIGFGVLSGLAAPLAAVTLRTRLSRFGSAQRLRLLTVDQTVIRTAGTTGMLVLPFAVDAAPAAAFAGAGVFLTFAAAVAAVAGRRATTAAKAQALPASETLRVPEVASNAP